MRRAVGVYLESFLERLCLRYLNVHDKGDSNYQHFPLQKISSQNYEYLTPFTTIDASTWLTCAINNMLIRTTEHHQKVFEGSPSRGKTTKNYRNYDDDDDARGEATNGRVQPCILAVEETEPPSGGRKKVSPKSGLVGAKPKIKA